jgi:hypothetical protein
MEIVAAESGATPARLSWRAVAGALRGNALAAFPREAFEQEVVVREFLGCRLIIENRPEAIRHVLIANAENAAEALPRLVQTRAVVDEALRLYPPSFVIVREAIGDDFVEGIAAPAGSLVMIAPWVLHRHRALWKDPERFDPARFLPGAPAPDRFAYLPFGIGPRTCIGQSFALTELVLVLAILIRAFKVELDGPRAVVPMQPGSPPAFLLGSREAQTRQNELRSQPTRHLFVLALVIWRRCA